MPANEVLTNPCDPFFANVKLLVVFDGANDSTVFRDYSPTNKIPQINRNVVITTDEKKFRTGSATYKQDPNDNFIVPNKPSLTYGPSPDFNLDGNWTLDFWLKIKSGRVVGNIENPFNEYFMSIGDKRYFRLDTQQQPRVHCTWFYGMGNESDGITGPLNPGEWYHFALVHIENKEWYFYLNGKLKFGGIEPSDTSGGGSE